MAATDVITYSEALARGIITAEAHPASRVTPLISVATQRLETATGSYFVQRTYVERHEIYRQRRRDIVLYRRPIVSVESIEDLEGNTIPSTDYYVLADEARLVYKSGYWPWSSWLITIVGGKWATTAEVGAHVKEAAYLMLQDALTQDGSRTIESERVGPVSVTYAAQQSWQSLPQTVMDLLSAEMHVGV